MCVGGEIALGTKIVGEVGQEAAVGSDLGREAVGTKK